MKRLPNEMTQCERCGRWFQPPNNTTPRLCPVCEDYEDWLEKDDLPELTPEEHKAIKDRIQPDFIERIIRGERPLTDPDTFAN